MNTFWIVLAAVSIILLFKYFRSRNAVWGGLTAGILVGVIWALFRAEGFRIIFVGKSAVVGTLAGFAAEMLGALGNVFGKRIGSK